MRIRYWFLLPLLFIFLVQGYGGVGSLPSWREGEAKGRIVRYVEEVTDKRSSSYIEPEDRVAVLDLDGTLMCERPVNYQRALALKRLREHVKERPELRVEQPFKAAWEADASYHNVSGNHNGIFLKAFEKETQEEYERYIRRFLRGEKAEHWGVGYQELFYRPGLELVKYLRDNGFEVYVCSTTEEGCIRELLKEVMGMKPENVIGNEVEMEVKEREGQLHFILCGDFKKPENREYGKCLYIQNQVGKRPVVGFGNTMGDYGMLKLVGSGGKRSLVMVLDHDDKEREVEYRDKELLGKAKEEGWVVVSMKGDFGVVFDYNSKEGKR